MDKIGLYNAMHVDGRKGIKFEKIINDINEYGYNKILFFNEWEAIFCIDASIDEFKNFKNFLKEKNVIFYLLCGVEFQELHVNEEKYGNLYDENFIFLAWPTFLIHLSFYALKHLKNKNNVEIKETENFDYLFLSYNNKKSYHRCLLIDLMCEKAILNLGLYSWRMNDDFMSKNYKFKHWNETLTEIDSNKNTRMNEWTNNIFDTNEFITIVPETSYEYMFITEKTFKPILLEKPFLCFGYKNQNTILKKFGFVLYDEIIDYSFDTKESLEERANGIVNNLIVLKDQNLKLLHNTILDKIKRNKKRALEIVDNDPFIPNELVTLYKNNKNKFDEAIENEIIPDWFIEIMKNK